MIKDIAHIIKSYSKYLLNSQNQHGLHSPFAYNLVTKCFYDKKPKPEYQTLKHYRQNLLYNKATIQVIDFGAGSRVFKTNNRPISKIAQTAGISPKRSELLLRLVQYFQPQNILEIGTSLGLATSALSLGNTNAKITTLEGCPQTAKIAAEQFQSSNLKNINLLVTEFDFYIQNLNSQKFDLIYFDGNHQKESTLNYFNLLLPTITNDAVWIFDDIHWSPQMESAWEAIKQNPSVTLTIDTFQWGIVFFRREQQKEHFIIRV